MGIVCAKIAWAEGAHVARFLHQSLFAWSSKAVFCSTVIWVRMPGEQMEQEH